MTIFRLIFTSLYILQYIFYTNGQKVQKMPPVESCVASSVTLRCPSNSVIVVTSAEYGVAQISGSCSYSPGDCVADAMSIVICNTDSVQCNVYATKKKLPQCNDQYGSYVHIEFDCVPLSMDDPSKEYNVCQNGTDITSDSGILKSPGYPSQFQLTTAECFRAIHVPSDKAIRLWLSDLYISSAGINCPKDHIYVVDSIQTYRHCGVKRYAYPYLCSSTIIIQYLAQTQASYYRGLRMYFEIVDRVSNDICPNPNGTVTPIASTTTISTTTDRDMTTTVPIYVILGISSPVRSFQLCQGQSHTLQCPNNYVVTIRTNIYGVTQSGQCQDHDATKHCVVTTDPPLWCRQSCSYTYTGNQVIPSCNNNVATYQYVEYQCIPTKSVVVTPNIPCPADGSKIPIKIDRSGRFRNYNFPIFTKMNCTYRLSTKVGDIMHIYSLDINMNDFDSDCKANKISFVEDGETQGSDFCEEYTFSLLYSTCSNEIDLRYIVGNANMDFSDGAELYIESQARPFDWSCGQPAITTPTTPSTPTIPFTTPTAAPLTNETTMGARDELEHDICYTKSLSYTCPTGYTFMMIGAFYGVKKQASNQCEFVQGDCVHETLSTLTQCQTDAPSCYISYSSQRRLAQCQDKYADYLHITSQCVPSRSVGTTATIRTYDICDTNNDIADFSGIVTSPGYPSYKQTNGVCKRSLIGIQDRVLKIWINQMAVGSDGQRSANDESNEPNLVIYKNHENENLGELIEASPSVRDVCINDYLIVNTPHTAYVYCGKRKLAIMPICAARVDIQYKGASPPNIFYKGFKFYFEWMEKPVEINCGGNPGLSTTTLPQEPDPIWAQNLELSPILSHHICLGNSHTLRCPRGSDYVLSVIESNYGVTGTGMCEIPSATHCHQEASLGLTCTHSCFIEYDFPKPLVQCGLQNADYLSIDYECIPTRLPDNENPIDICASATTDTIAMNAGMMISPQYPSLGAARTCSKRIETLSSKLWMVFIVDLFLEGSNDAGNCDAASFTISDGNDRIVLCGLQQPQLILVSCSNIVDFKFVSTHQALGYRGFKVFFQTVDVPSGWTCQPSGFSTTTPKPTTPRPPTTTSIAPPSSMIGAFGGTTNGTRQYCKLPFIYQGNTQTVCLRTDPPSTPSSQGVKGPWCSLTSNYDTDRQWGFCELGITDSSIYDICRGQSQALRCPVGYVIDIITADYAAKPDGSTSASACVYDQNDCFQSDSITIQTVCAGKPSCTAYHFAKTLTACQNRPSAYLHVDYTCIPNEIQEISIFNLCNNNTLPTVDTERGFLISPNFPNTQNNIDCTFNLQTIKPHQDIYVYTVDMDLNSPPLLGQTCTKDRLIISADNNVMETCGRSSTNFLLNTCHSSVSFQLIRASDAKGRGVKFYFEFRDRTPDEICPVLYTTTTRASTTSTSPRTTTEPPRPSYFPDPSPRDIKTLCYPDVSSLFGTNNFQCPKDYVLVIHRAFYGKGERCAFTSGDCTSEADIVYRTCAGKQACSVSFISSVNLPECNKAIATYLFVEYQCLPTPTIITTSADLCSGQLSSVTGPSGLLKSPSYPSYVQTQCDNVTLSTDSAALVAYIYLLDLNLNLPDVGGVCSNDYLSLSYQCNNQLYSVNLCGTRQTELLFSTCSPTDKIFASYGLLSSDTQAYRGFALLYHLLPQSTVVTTTATRPPSTTTTTTPTTGPGPISTSNQIVSTCVQQSITLRCEQPQYGLIIHKVELGASTTGSCLYSSTDCFEDRTNLYNLCAGKPTCNIFPPLLAMKGCNNTKSNYLYAEYQCIPLRPKLNLDVCSTADIQRVEGGAIISSLNYTSIYQDCKVQLQSAKLLGSQAHKAFRIYILTFNLPVRGFLREQGAQCSENDPKVDINDPESGLTRLCGSSHTRYLLETCSDTVDIRFNNVQMSTGTAKYKGFEIYIESVQNEKCRPPTTPPVPTAPFVIQDVTACGLVNGRERVSFSCTPGHGLTFLQSYQFVTKQPDQCDVKQNTCFFPSEQPTAQCAGQELCSYTHPMSTVPTSSLCNTAPADAIQFYYQCIPMRPTPPYPTYTLCNDKQTTQDKGFIQTIGFPRSYQYGIQQCSLRIASPSTADGRKYSVYLYIIEISLRDGSVINPSSTGECLDSIKYSTGDADYQLCGKINQPSLEFHSKQQEINLTIDIPTALAESQWNDWQGARLFYIIGDQNLPTPPLSPTGTSTTSTSSQTTTTDDSATQSSTKSPKKPSHGGLIAGIIIGILVVLGGVAGALYYRRRISSRGANSPTVSYGSGAITMENPLKTDTTRKQATSIPTGSLKGTLKFTSPFYQASATAEKEDAAEVTDA
ncbi:hypothetical protein I4U23_006794 [Adineta vaga]|nr:hypothetical protein I4U23_006794 [Adineta vaga]